jgi:hypothetical protein
VCVTVVLGSFALGGPVTAAPVLPDTAPIRLTTPKSDLGSNPVLKWRSVRDAVSYLVVVQTPKGKPYWSWRGIEPRVRLGGGGDDAVEESEGASLQRRMMWFVVAFDADGAAIASSAKRPIAP